MDTPVNESYSYSKALNVSAVQLLLTWSVYSVPNVVVPGGPAGGSCDSDSTALRPPAATLERALNGVDVSCLAKEPKTAGSKAPCALLTLASAIFGSSLCTPSSRLFSKSIESPCLNGRERGSAAASAVHRSRSNRK